MNTDKRKTIVSDTRIKIRGDIGIEDFEESSLVLLCDSMQLREVNEGARRLLDLIDGNRTAGEIAGIVADDLGISRAEAMEIIAGSLLEMERQGIVMRQVRIDSKHFQFSNDRLLVSHPDVVLWHNTSREATLFMPDRADYIMLNETAVEIWKKLASPVTVPDLIEHLETVCSDVPMDRIEQDVREFLEYLLEKNFAGEMEISR